jgi:hypothetical protein
MKCLVVGRPYRMTMAILWIIHTVLVLPQQKNPLSTQPASPSCSRPVMSCAIGPCFQDVCTSARAFLLTAKNGCASLRRKEHLKRHVSCTLQAFKLPKRLRLESRQATYRPVRFSSSIMLFLFCPGLDSGSIGSKSIRETCKMPLCLCLRYLRSSQRSGPSSENE